MGSNVVEATALVAPRAECPFVPPSPSRALPCTGVPLRVYPFGGTVRQSLDISYAITRVSRGSGGGGVAIESLIALQSVDASGRAAVYHWIE